MLDLILIYADPCNGMLGDLQNAMVAEFDGDGDEINALPEPHRRIGQAVRSSSGSDGCFYHSDQKADSRYKVIP